jgi:hypothetical protein
MNKSETHAALRQDTEWTNHRPVSLVCPFCILFQYCLCLWFVHSLSFLNAACVCGLSILCLVSMLHVSLICSFCVLSQYCLCHWRKDREWTNQRHRQYWNKMQNGQTRETGSIETKHIMNKPETQAVLLVCPFSVLFQSCLCLWFIHSLSYPNASCDWSSHSVSCPNTAWVSDLSIICFGHMRYWDRTHNGLIRGTCSIETRLIIDKPETQVVLRQNKHRDLTFKEYLKLLNRL